MRFTRWWVPALTATLTVVSLAAREAPAQARDNQPCGLQRAVSSPSYAGLAQYCPLWRGDVPVYARPGRRKVVGYLFTGGDANWFLWQKRYATAPYRYDGLSNRWWAYTVADNGQFGFVPEVFFSGGTNGERDGRLVPRSTFIRLRHHPV